MWSYLTLWTAALCFGVSPPASTTPGHADAAASLGGFWLRTLALARATRSTLKLDHMLVGGLDWGACAAAFVNKSLAVFKCRTVAIKVVGVASSDVHHDWFLLFDRDL